MANPNGDSFNVDFAAHEWSHQFGHGHTFSGVGGSCDGNFMVRGARRLSRTPFEMCCHAVLTGAQMLVRLSERLSAVHAGQRSR